MLPKRACDNCNRRKIHCDRAIPQCNWCESQGLVCAFDRPRLSRKRNMRTNFASGKDIAQRIDRIELVLHAIQSEAKGAVKPSEPGASSSSISATSVGTSNPELDVEPTTSDISTGNTTSTSEAFRVVSPAQGVKPREVHFADYHVAEVNSFTGIPFFSKAGRDWICSRTGENPKFGKLCSTSPPWEAPSLGYPSPMPLSFGANTVDWDVPLPSKSVVKQLVTVYCASNFRLAFPLIDPVIFQSTVDLAYTAPQGADSPKLLVARACTFSFLSLISLCKTGWSSMPPVDGTLFAARSRNLLPQVLLNVSFEAFQAIFMLSYYHLLSGHIQQASLLHSLSSRILFALGAHSHPMPVIDRSHVHTICEPLRLSRHVRNLFWLSFSLDKDISFRTGQPPSIDAKCCDLTLPSPEELGPDEGLAVESWDGISSPKDLRIAVMLSKTCSALYSVASLGNSDTELLRNVLELDDKLEQWRLSICPENRPSLLISENSSPGLDSTLRGRNVYLRMQQHANYFDYYYLVSVIHRASGRCGGWKSSESSDLDGISSSTAISVQASRSTLMLFRSTATLIVQEAFWLLIFYPISAAITIFCNVLLDPLDPQALDDLGLISSVPALIRKMPHDSEEARTRAFLTMVDDFIAELTRLGDCAIKKATNNTRGG